jgi:hypothetical protein
MADCTIYHDAAVEPGTHALVIGVGKYTHLAGGEAPVANPDGMGQLTSPPISARAVAQWLRAEFHDDAKPLASLSLLLSELEPEPFEAKDVTEATIDNIESAVREWRHLANGHHDNRAIFYFCGHGVSQGKDMALLASDVFADELNPLNGALDFSSLMAGMARCCATQQVFFVDACRASSDTLIEQSGDEYAGRVPLGAGRRPLEWPRRFAIPYYATLAGSPSHARPNRRSLFTEALLRAFKGAGSDDPEGDWRVSTSQLHTAIDHFMKQQVFAGTVAGVQAPTVGELPVFDLHYLSDPPVVPVYVGCQQVADNAESTFVCRRSGQERLRRDVADVDGERPDADWPIDLPFGEYEFEARVRGGPDVWSKTLTVRPVYRKVKLGADA